MGGNWHVVEKWNKPSLPPWRSKKRIGEKSGKMWLMSKLKGVEESVIKNQTVSDRTCHGNNQSLGICRFFFFQSLLQNISHAQVPGRTDSYKPKDVTHMSQVAGCEAFWSVLSALPSASELESHIWTSSELEVELVRMHYCQVVSMYSIKSEKTLSEPSVTDANEFLSFISATEKHPKKALLYDHRQGFADICLVWG